MKKCKTKYNAKKILLPNGQRFDSKHEYERYLELVKLQEQGVISELKCQVPFKLVDSQKLPHPYYQKNKKNDKKRMIKTWQGITYYADFTYKNSSGELVCEDAKGMKTDVYILKKKLVLAKYGIQIMEV